MADNPASGGLPAKAAAALGLPEGAKFYTPYPFGGMNRQAAPTSIDDKEFVYLENFVKTGDGQLRTLWDVGLPVYIAPQVTPIVYYSFWTLATKYYCAIFLSDGSAVNMDMADYSVTQIGPPSTFYQASTGYLPCARQWGSTYLLISNRNSTNDYWVYDGTTLYQAGSAAPNGVTLTSPGFGYGTAPAVTAYGGSGAGMTFTAEVDNGAVTQVLINNPGTGYLPGDVVQLSFSGGGSDSGAVLQPYLTAGAVGGVSISAHGSGYTSAPAVAFSGGGGLGAAGTAIISVGVTSITGLVGGSNYTSPPVVAFSGGGGGGAQAFATVLGGQVTSVVITNPGSGYATAPTISFTGGGGTLASATAVISSGVIGVSLTSDGSGYTSAPTVAFSGGGGVGAIATAVLSPQGVGGVTVVSGGSGYTFVPLITIQGGGGSGAVATAVLTPTTVARINITAGGANYTLPPTVNFTGNGFTGSSGYGGSVTPVGYAVMNGGQVVGVDLTNAGAGIVSPVEVTFTNATGDTTGAGAGGTVVLTATSIASVIIANAGQFYTNAPDAILSAGANNAASGTVSLMPFGVSGSAMETYLSRVWIVNPATAPFETISAGDIWNFSAAGSVVDFATSDGGGSAINTDAFLQTQYVNVRQSSGYLYFMGDGSVSQVSSVSTTVTATGAIPTTNYNYLNIDPQSGASWRDSVQDFGKSIVLANDTGIYAVYGGSLAKVSGKLDQLLNASPQGRTVYPAQGGVIPSSAIATIFNIRHYLNLVTQIDPTTNKPRNVMIAWNEKDWFIASQSIEFTFIASQKIGSDYAAWGTDGTHIWPLFNKPSAALPKYIWTKIYGADSMFVQKEALYLWLQAQDKSTAKAGISGEVLSDISTIGPLLDGATPPFVSQTISTVQDQPAFSSPDPAWAIWGTGLSGFAFTSMGLRFTTKSPDFILGNMVICYRNAVAYSG